MFHTKRTKTLSLAYSCRATTNSDSTSSGGQITFVGLDQQNCGKPVKVTEGQQDDWRVILTAQVLQGMLAFIQ